MTHVSSPNPAKLRRFLARTSRAAACIALGCAALVACTPAYDWRTVTNNDDGYEVTLPAKPRAAERKIDIAGQPITMRMQTAEAGDAVFAVGTVVLPSADPALQRAALDYLEQGLARNVNAHPDARTTEIDLAAGGHVTGSEMQMRGQGRAQSGEKPEARTIQARFVARGAHVYQVAIVSDHAPPAEQAEQFFSSFKLF
ncbi:hypothetical protein [Caballeronia sp. Lep1P3]|uniref:hypothetical protein n=1 Tax=Caballeronia sp. Lep1P3 TaxID=2878150 RepID=UPI001FD49499|nr:hypothetical protein [Caballeronia sp. Lep1P3]